MCVIWYCSFCKWTYLIGSTSYVILNIHNYVMCDRQHVIVAASNIRKLLTLFFAFIHSLYKHFIVKNCLYRKSWIPVSYRFYLVFINIYYNEHPGASPEYAFIIEREVYFHLLQIQYLLKLNLSRNNPFFLMLTALFTILHFVFALIDLAITLLCIFDSGLY